MGFYDFMEIIPSGRRLHNELENHHAIHGKTQDISMAIFNSELLVYWVSCVSYLTIVYGRYESYICVYIYIYGIL